MTDRETDAPAHPVKDLPARHASLAPRDWLRLHGAIGNAAVAGMLNANAPVQRDADAPLKSRTSSDEGGVASVTELEHDMRDVLRDWQAGAKDGISLFVTRNLSARLDDLESGSWKTFVSSLIGNTIWAAAAFTPIGASVLAFRISMVGIGVAAVPTTPSRSKSAIPKMQELALGYINDIYNQLNGELREKASALLEQYSNITRYRALAAFVQSSFAPGMYVIDASNRTIPRLLQTPIADRFVDIASERLDIATTVGQSTTGGGYADEWSSAPNETTVTEVAWIRGSVGKPRLAILESRWDGNDTGSFVPKDATHALKNWVSAENSDAAIAQWAAARGQSPATYYASQIDQLSG